jgi:hypothetical protein
MYENLISQLKTKYTNHDIHIFSNHPEVRLTEENAKRVKSITYNTLSDPEANSYCARSWNNIFIKAFKDNDDAMFVQDDTAIHPNISNLIRRDCDKYDLAIYAASYFGICVFTNFTGSVPPKYAWNSS